MKIKHLIAPSLITAILALGGAGLASAQTAPRVALQFATGGLTSPLIASTSSSTVARLVLDTTGSSEAVRISTLPFNLIVGGGGIASTLNNCRVYNEANSQVALNANNPVTFASGLNSFVLDAPLILSANTISTVALRCDVAANLVNGSTYTINMDIANVVATGATTGLPAIVTVRGAIVTPPPVFIPPVYTPGIPATGAGGQLAQNLTMLGASTLLAAIGLSLMYRRKRALSR